MTVQPFILGSGRSGRAVRESLLILRMMEPELGILDPIALTRDQRIEPDKRADKSVLFVCTPHALHAKSLLAAWRSGFHAIGCEKPACTRPEDLGDLGSILVPTAIFHVYRALWGPQMLKQMLAREEFGRLISIEGRYWQASMAARRWGAASWKNDRSLNGPADTLFDLGTHWMDLAIHLAGSVPEEVAADLSYANSEHAHRDSHAWIKMVFAHDVRAFASISKNIHGATNQLEIHVMGTKKSASWNLLRPDEIEVGEGSSRSLLFREQCRLGSQHAPFHGLGWIEGYIEIIRQLLRDANGLPSADYPRLRDSLQLMRVLFSTPALRGVVPRQGGSASASLRVNIDS
jgi:predicted dehydrogenase